MSTQKISFRFLGDHEVRAAWDASGSRLLFSVADIVGVLTDSANPRKYWSVLKTRLKVKVPQLTTECSQLIIRQPLAAELSAAETDFGIDGMDSELSHDVFRG